MKERRCPNCGALVGADAQWCGQCLQRLEPAGAAPDAGGSATVPPELIPGTGPSGNGGPPETEEREPPTARAVPRGAPVATRRGGPPSEPMAGAVRAGERGIVWDCPTCQNENPLEASTCSVCGTPFASLVAPSEPPPAVEPGRAAMFSLFYPGLGHYLVGRTAEAVARAVVFTFAIATGLTILIGGLRSGFGALLPLMVISLVAAGAVYVLSTLDAGKVAQGDTQILTPRMLLYGATGLILMTLVFFILAATSAAPRT